jgi:hypothetical protein
MANGGFFTTGGVIMPTIDEVQVPNLQWLTTFTADPSTNLLTCPISHKQVAGEVVMVTSTGVLPAPLVPFKLYRVPTAGLGWVKFGGPSDFVTASAVTDQWTTPFPHGLVADMPVMFVVYSGVYPGMPSPLYPATQYFVAAAGMTATKFKVAFGPGGPPVDLFTDSNPATNFWLFYMTADPTALQLAENEGWNPPPENPSIDLLDAGVGVHQLWVRPLDYVGRVNSVGGNYVSAEAIGCPRGAIYLDNGKRHQYKNQSTGGFAFLALPNTDYWTSGAQQSPWTRWQMGINPGVTDASADLYAYDYPATALWGLGDLGVFVAGAGEHYYNICGNCAFGGGGPPTGAGGGKGGEVRPVAERQIKIEYRDQDITNLVRRAQKASNTIENLRIVGPGVSGGGGQWQINPD